MLCCEQTCSPSGDASKAALLGLAQPARARQGRSHCLMAWKHLQVHSDAALVPVAMHYTDKARQAGSTAQPWRCVATHVLTAPTRTGLQCSADQPDSEQVCGLLLMMLACCRMWIRARVAMLSCEAAILAVTLGKLVSGFQEPAAATNVHRRPQAADRRCAAAPASGRPSFRTPQLQAAGAPRPSFSPSFSFRAVPAQMSACWGAVCLPACAASSTSPRGAMHAAQRQAGACSHLRTPYDSASGNCNSPLESTQST